MVSTTPISTLLSTADVAALDGPTVRLRIVKIALSEADSNPLRGYSY